MHFVQVHSPGEVTMRTWERGSGITLACGTGASAVCVAGSLTGRAATKILAHLPGGDLELEWGADDHVYMTGPATEVFSGEWHEDNGSLSNGVEVSPTYRDCKLSVPALKRQRQYTNFGKDARSWKRVNRLLGLLAATTIRFWMCTLDYKAAFYDPAVDPVDPRYRGQKIYIFWHENILFPLYLRGHCNLAMLLSRHRDADILSEVADLLGFEFVRGSTFGGGSSAIRELLRRGEDELTITPDGPRGPRRQLAQGRSICRPSWGCRSSAGDGLRSSLACK